MHNIESSVRIKIADGPEIKEISTQAVEAYEEIVFEILGDETKCVEVQPSSKEQIVFLLIKSSRYTDKDNRTYKILYGVEIAKEPTIELDNSHLYQGIGEISTLQNEPKNFRFKNTYPGSIDEEKEQNKAEIQILVGRKATITCPTITP